MRLGVVPAVLVELVVGEALAELGDAFAERLAALRERLAGARHTRDVIGRDRTRGVRARCRSEIERTRKLCHQAPKLPREVG
jgi:hypothetical protein